jgi:hypothetical protein
VPHARISNLKLTHYPGGYLGRSFRGAVWLGLAAGFLLALAVPEVQLIRDW